MPRKKKVQSVENAPVYGVGTQYTGAVHINLSWEEAIALVDALMDSEDWEMSQHKDDLLLVCEMFQNSNSWRGIPLLCRKLVISNN
jgi:hypothetical protein